VSVNLLAETLRDQSMLSSSRYVGGVTSYLEVLDTERQRLSAEQQLTQARRDVLISLVQLYKALGGGWQ
jgi:multidrug efflux system outer membrane protein